MLKPKDSDSPDEVGMDDILRSIQGILGEAPEANVTFPAPDQSANDPAPTPTSLERREAPLSFLQRKRPPETIEPVLDHGPAMPSLDERLARHRAKADAERAALRALTERATARVAESEPLEAPVRVEPELRSTPSEPTVPRSTEAAPVPQTAELDIFAESEDLIEPPQKTPRRARRIELPDIQAEPVDYSGGPLHGVPSADETFEEIARSILAEKADDMDGVLADMMRPLVREWLEDNLSGVVERVVREEIERISRGGR